MTTTSTNLVPTSIQRVRAFLNDVCGMKVRPWASVEETLHALHGVLVARRDCTIFWKSLRVLLEQLARDLRSREDATPGEIIDNEVLNTERYAALLDEIQAAVVQAPSTKGSFAKLASALSLPAVALLLLLGGVATVGCGSQTSLSVSRRDAAQDILVPTDASTANPEDASVVSLPKSDVGGSTSNDDSPVFTFPPRPDAAVIADTAPRLCDGACSIEDIMAACGMAPGSRQSVSACIERLRTSWREGLTSGIAARSCDDIGTILSYCLPNYCQPGNVSTSDFDPNILGCQMPPVYPIYIGIRFA
jgi:hypothetical protein